MRTTVAIAVTLAVLCISGPALADKESDCQKGVATLKSEVKKKHPQQVRAQLQSALKNAQKEVDEGDWDECVDAVNTGRRALGR